MINKVILVGNVGKEPQIRYTPGGDAIANFTVATTERYKSKKTGEMIVNTEWHSITCFGFAAKFVGDYVKKGAQVYIEGKIKTEKWQDKQTGVDKYSTKIMADTVQLLGKKHNEGETREQDIERGQHVNDEFDDDIPF